MKGKLGLLIVFVFLLTLTFSSCDMGNTGSDNSIQTFFSSSNMRNQRGIRAVNDSDIEFLVTNLLLVRDDAPYNGWLIGHPENNWGWYDIDGINRASVKIGDKNAARHSVVRLSIKGIRINDKVYSIDMGTGDGTLTTKDNIPITNLEQFDIIAGDLSKIGLHENINGSAPNIPFDGVADLYNDVQEFIVVVDESKLHDNGTLKVNWWECFSFITR